MYKKQVIQNEYIDLALTDIPSFESSHPSYSPSREYVKQYFKQHQKDNMAILYFDISNFKSINDSFGREYGDIILKQVSKRIKDIQFDKFMISRLLADEFLILVENLETPDNIHDFLNLLSEAFELPFNILETNFGLSYNVGVAMYPEDDYDFDNLFNYADIAMHKAKNEETRKVEFYHPDFKDRILQKLYMESELRNGLKNQEFCLFYQPQVDVQDNTLLGFEALIRWIKPDGRVIPPFHFITSAEETGLMVPMGNWVFEEACNFVNRLEHKGYSKLCVSVNISAVQIADDNFVDIIKQIVDSTQVDTSKLQIEITESVLMKNMKATTAKILELQHMGFIIALDDFGIGYSSLSYLRQLPIDVLKLDKSFIDDINQERKNLVGAMINLGHELELDIIAEGIEEFHQLEYLRQYNCDFLQGYLISKPIPEEEVFQFLEKYA
ncbi:MAG: hypothetical protein BEN19_05490 [Epulopiscium sp. Nuni2H_MBin003]|nr:MAG: hypothetical protein BEN19_05490 [Epulopiscium sp. Nuni2H_MBin003]